MEELFGVSMSTIMLVMVAIFVPCIVVVAAFAARNRIMLKLGLRNLPRRRGQTALSLMGIMLSTVIIAAALGTGDTISFSIRNETVEALGNIDEIIVSTRAGEDEQFGRQAYVPIERFDALRAQLAGDERIDGLAAQLAESAPTVNTRTSLSEGRMRVVGIDPSHMAGFRDFTLVSGGVAQLAELAEDEAYINDRAAEELDAVAGDELQVFQGDDRSLSFRVKGVVSRGGLAGRDPTLLLPLARAQGLFDRAGQVNLFVISNRGDAVAGAELSEDVTKELRVLFTDVEVVGRLRDVLGGEAALAALNEKLEELKDARKEEFGKLINELATDPPSEELINLLADDQVSAEVLDALDAEEHKELQREVISQFVDIGEFRVISVKHRALSEADEAGSGVTGFFMIMGLFSIMVGVLLIFLIFVMLAAARRSEMGMARAVGAKRRHLVQMFVFEGTAYALASAALGVVLGLLVSGLMVEVINRVFATVEEDFQMTRHFELRSVVVAYTLGMVITFGTVIFSAVRVSRLNIVVAIRGLPDALAISPEPPFLRRFSGFLRVLFRPLVFLAGGARALWRRRWMDSLRGLALAAAWLFPPLWIGDIVAGLLRFVWPYLLRGWLTIGVGAGFIAWGVSAKLGAPFAAGVSVVLLGLGLGTRKLLQYTSFPEHLRDRAAFSATGIAMLVYWAMPSDIFKGITGELERDFEMMFISGIFMVTAAVFTILYNANLLVSALVFATGRVGKLRPVLVTAIAYPMSARFRTGLTLAMFALVIFTLMVMSVLTESFSASFSGDAEMIVGGWDVEGVSSLATPIEDIRESIDLEPSLQIDDFIAIGGYTRIGVQVRQVGGENQRWRGYRIRAADDEFLDNPGFKLKLIADGYGSTDSEAWQALKADPSLARIHRRRASG